MVDFDCIIAGAGAAGSVLAKRLSEDPNNNVRLEYGGRDWSPLIYVPKGFYYTLRGELYAYHYSTQPTGPRGQREVWTRGKGLGGSTAVNGMMWTRGAAADWDGLEARGNPGWNWVRALAAYRTIEDHSLGAELFATNPLSDYVLAEDFPGPAVSSSDDVLRHLGSEQRRRRGSPTTGPRRHRTPRRRCVRPAGSSHRQQSGTDDGGRLDRRRLHPRRLRGDA
jgi:choline dehydrogenase-like flavoprotein